jgi:hypothetical protein
MQKLILSLIFLSYISISQDASWVKIVTDEVGIDARGFRVWVADVNGDDYPDLLWGGDVGAVRNHIYLMLNQQDPESNNPKDRIFVDASLSSGIQTSRIDTNDNRIADVAALGDVDNDGDLDLVTSIYTHRSQNYTNFERTVYDTTIVDGKEVITDSTFMVIRDPGDRTELLLNDGSGNFTLFENSGLNDLIFDDEIPSGFANTSAICFLDYNRDGNLDIYFGTWFIDYALPGKERYMPNILVKGNGDGTFEKVGEIGPAEPLYGATVFDWNNDGWVDIATSSYCRTSSRLFMNMGGEFVDATDLSNYNTQRLGGDNNQNLCQWEALPGDFDNDGDLDLLEVKVHGGYRDGEGRTTITTNAGEEGDYLLNWDLSRINRNTHPDSHIGDMGGAWMDWDNDGDLDMMIGQDGYTTANPPGGVRLFFLTQDDNGIFNEVTQNLGILPELEDSHSMEPADYDLDGDLDLFISSTHKDTIIEDGEQRIVSYKRIELLENTIGNANNWIAITPELSGGMVYNGTRIELYQEGKIMTREIHQGGGHFGNQHPETQYFGLGETARIDSIKIKFNGDTDEVVKINSLAANRHYKIGVSGFEATDNYNQDGNGILDINGLQDFGEVFVNETFSKTITFKNDGQEVLKISGIELDGDEEFTKGFNMYAAEIPPGIEGNFVINFTPKLRKEYSTKLTFNTDSKNSKSNNEYTIELIGAGFEEKSIAMVSTDSLFIEPVFIGENIITELKLSNIGELPLQVSDITMIGDDNLSLINDQIIEIEANSNKTLEISFTPDSLGDYFAELTISSNGYLSEELKVMIFANCNGPLPDPKITGLPLINFGDVNLGEKSIKSFEITNSGEGNFIIKSIEMQEDVEDFAINSTDLPINIEPNGNYTFDVEFTPTDENVRNASAQFIANIENDLEVFMRGNGIVLSLKELSDGSKLELAAYPNPITRHSKIKAELTGRANLVANLFIVNLDGKVILKSNAINLYEGENSLNMNLTVLNSGVYYLVSQTQFGSNQIKLIVE